MVVLLDHTEDGLAVELLRYLTPYMTGAPASDDLPLDLGKLSQGAGPARAVLSELVDALSAHAKELPAADLVPAYTLLADTVAASVPDDDPASSLELAKRMADKLAEDPSDRPAARLGVLHMLYARSPEPAWRYELLLAILRFAKAARHPQAVPSLALVKAALGDWGVEPARRVAAIDAACDAAEAAGTPEPLCQAWRELLVEELDGADDAARAARTPRTVAAVAGALAAEGTFELDALAKRKAVARLAQDGSPEAAAVSELLGIFVSGGPADLEQCLAGPRAGAVAGLGLEPEALRAKMRVLAVASLCQRLSKGPAPGPALKLTFAQVAEAAGVPESEAEHVVVDAVGKGALRAKVDEPGKTVEVAGFVHREFGPEQWRQLHDTLGEWRASVSKLLEVLASAEAVKV